ncbi:MAG: tRNA-intron lyase [Candidatus Methanomethylophilaceae archaeon]
MPGELKGDTVIVSDQREGSQLYSKGNYGYPLSGGGLELDLTEAVYLMESGRLLVESGGEKVEFDELFAQASKQNEGFDVKYLVYRDMRSRGFVVKTETGGFDLSVFPRGKTMSNSRPEYMVRAVSERTVLDINDFSAEISHTEGKGRELLYGVADEEGDVTYYKMSTRDPRGSVPMVFAGGRIDGVLISDRVFVFDAGSYGRLKEVGFFGKDIGGALQLSLIESCYLSEKGALNVLRHDGRAVGTEELKKLGSETQSDFALRISAYYDLRSRGLVVKTGFKYGTHFRVYEGSPDDCHARYLVHAVPASDTAMWPEISRTVRLSGGVKKDILFCRISGGIEYLEFKWFRP